MSMEIENQNTFENLFGELEDAVFQENWEAAGDIIERASKLGFPTTDMQQYVDAHRREEPEEL